MASGSALILFPILWGVVTVGLTPVLASDRVRSVLSVRPTNQLAINYLLATTTVSVLHGVVFIVGGVAFPPGSVGLIEYALGLNVVIPLCIWLISVSLLPRVTDIDGRRLALPLGFGAIWYTVITMGLFGFLALLIFLAFAP